MAVDPLAHRDAWAAASAAAFEACAQAYSDNVAPMFAALSMGAIERAEIRSGAAVVDLGCTAGATTRAVALRVGARGTAVGIDPSATLLARASSADRASPRRAAFVRGELSSLPIAPGRFSALVSCFPPHGPARPAELLEAFRVTREGGTVSFLDMGPGFMEPFSDAVAILQRFGTSTPSPVLAGLRESSRSAEEALRMARQPDALARALSAAGFEDVAVREARARQRLWGITNFMDIVLSFPLPHTEFAEMGPDARELAITVAQEEFAGFMHLEEFVAEVPMVGATARKPSGGN